MLVELNLIITLFAGLAYMLRLILKGGKYRSPDPFMSGSDSDHEVVVVLDRCNDHAYGENFSFRGILIIDS